MPVEAVIERRIAGIPGRNFKSIRTHRKGSSLMIIKRILSGTAAVAIAAALTMASQAPAWAQGEKKGFATEETQGNSGKTNENANPDNQGQVTTTGPKGQVAKGNTDCNNCESSGPGRSN